MKLYIKVFFKEVLFERGHVVRRGNELVVKPTDLMPFEQVVVVKFFFHALPHRTKMGIVWDVHRTSIMRYLNRWAPRWAKYGEHLSILPIPEDYFRRELPDEFDELRISIEPFIYDGKDNLMNSKHKDDAMRWRQRSSKRHASAGTCRAHT